MINKEAIGLGLNKAQRQAVDNIEGPMLVLAGPGTGKTHLLTQRVANILKKTDTLPQNILCLTYTDSAAHTMRDRLSNLIGQAAYDVTISTYHGFGREIIQRYFEYFTDVLNQHVIDELGQDTLLREIQAGLDYSDPLKSDFYLNDIKTLLGETKRTLLSPEQLLKIIETNSSFYSQVRPILKEIFKTYKRLDTKSANFFEELSLTTQPIVKKSPKNARPSIGEIWLATLNDALELWHTTGKTNSITRWKNEWLVKDNLDSFIAAGENHVTKLRSFSKIYSEYEKKIKERMAYDYDDMINKAIEAIEKHPDLHFTLQEKYQYILLDEFQDTNGSQLRLIDLLTDNPVNEGRPNVMAVGDDDQAIYAFQGANYSNLISFTRLYKDVEIINLSENYRSTSSILNLADSISGQIVERLSSHLSGVGKSLAGTKDKTVAEIVQRDDFKSDVAQYSWVAEEILELIKKGVPANEIAVLAPRHRYLEPLVPYLHHAGISVRYEKRENVLRDPIVLGLIAMAKLVIGISKKNQSVTDSLWPEVLSSDFFGIPVEKLWQISWQVHDQKRAWEKALVENEATKEIALFFLKLSNMLNRESLENMFDYLIGITSLELDSSLKLEYRSPFYMYHFSEEAQNQSGGVFWQLLSNLTVLRQHLRERQTNESENLKLSDFVEFTEAYSKANINIINTSPYYESAEAVQLMTAYKAKGQEFTAVFVLGVSEEIWGNSASRRHSALALPPNLDYIRYAGSTNDERLRLFFVAITRAKQFLFLTSYKSTYTNRLLSSLKFLSETTDDDGSITSPLLPQKSQKVIQADVTAPELVSLTLYWQSRHVDASSETDLKSLLEPRLQRYQISPTHVNQYVDVINDGPRAFFLGTLLRFPKARQPLAQYGSAIHETLHWLQAYLKDKDKLPSESNLMKTFEERIGSKHLSEDSLGHLSERGKNTLSKYLSQKGGDINSNDAAEYNFRREGVFVGNAHLTGNIDKLVIDKENKKITIVDYKTGRVHKRWSKDLVLHKYRQQLYFYKILVERSHSFSGYQVEGAFLEFVEPDSKGQINQLWLDFDDSEQKQLEKLISGVWNSIMKLDFPDVSSYPSSLRGVEEFESLLSESAALK